MEIGNGILYVYNFSMHLDLITCQVLQSSFVILHYESNDVTWETYFGLEVTRFIA